MLALDGKVPRLVGFFLMESKPAGDYFELLAWERTCQQFSVDSNHCFIFAVIHMNMRLVVLAKSRKSI